MSFSYKKISPDLISFNKNIYNKKYIYNDNEFNNLVQIYIGENNPINKLKPFNYINDNLSTNNEYKRLLYHSIKHLFYKNFTPEGIFFSSSSFDNYLETTLHSGSLLSYNIRMLPDITSSIYYNNFGDVSPNSILYDNNESYDNGLNYDLDYNNKILILSISRDVIGNKILPSSFNINKEEIYIRDDGEGNLFNFINEYNYDLYKKNNINNYEFIGNIIYSLGFIIITNLNYFCIFNVPPTTINDYISYLNINPINEFDITANDFTECYGIDYSTIELHEIDGYSFPDCYINNNGFLQIIPNQNSYIPGNYKIGYTIKNSNGISSNTASINLNIDSQELEISEINNNKICYNTTGSTIPFSFIIKGGTPEYSWSKDGINYNIISGFTSPSIISSSTNVIFNKLYIKDYTGFIVSSSIDFYNPFINVEYNITEPYSCNDILSGTISFTSSQAISYSINDIPTLYNINNPINLITGSYNIKLYDINNCFTSSLININVLPQFNYTISINQPTCYNTNNGKIYIDYNDINPELVEIQIEHPISGTLIFNTSSLILNNIGSNEEYNIIINNNICSITENIITNNLPEIYISSSISYNNPCYNIIELFPSGGTPPYIYEIISPTYIYSSDSSSITLYNDNLNGIFITASISDNNGCRSPYIYKEIYGRKYIYSGSYCETI